MKFTHFSWLAWTTAGAVLVSGCGNTTEAHEDQDAVADTAIDAVAPGEGVTATDASDAAVGEDVPAVQVALTYTPVCKADGDCPNGNCIDGVCVTTPTEVGNLSDPANDYLPSTETLQTGCVDQPIADEIKGLPVGATVTMWGIVDRFGAGDVTSNIEVDVFKIGDFHPEVCAGIIDDTQRASCFADPAQVGTPIAHTISLDPDKPAVDAQIDVAAKVAAGATCAIHLDCPNGYDCQKVTGDVGGKICVKSHGVYAVENVPTNTELVVRVRKHDASTSWHDSYYWDIVLFSNHKDAATDRQPKKYVGTPTYHVDPTIVDEGQWELVPATLGMASIATGDGVVGGRIRDCGTAARGGFPIHDAKIAMGVAPAGYAFFNDNEDDTVPIHTKQSTDTLGRFAAVDLVPGANRISATAQVNGALVNLGSQNVFVVPNALMIVSLPGRIPVLTK